MQVRCKHCTYYWSSRPKWAATRKKPTRQHGWCGKRDIHVHAMEVAPDACLYLKDERTPTETSEP